MDIFRYSSNAWGQRVLEGVSWDWIGYFAGAGVVFIVLHTVYMFFYGKRVKSGE